MAIQQQRSESFREFPGMVSDVPLGRYSSFKCGGNASLVYCPKTLSDLSDFRRCDSRSIVCLGGLSNVLIRSGGIDDVVIRLKNVGQCDVSEQSVFSGGIRNVDACKMAASAGYSGIEFLVGIPGTIGGAIAMNAGADGDEVANVLLWVDLMNAKGEIERVKRRHINMTYRNGGITDGLIVVRACFRLNPSTQDKVAMRHAKLLCERAAKMNFGKNVGTAGSAFRNPLNEISGGRKAWELIDAAGCRGLSRGGVTVSEKHANFLLNMGNATPEDIENLGEEVRKRVLDATGVQLEWEIKILGKKPTPL